MREAGRSERGAFVLPVLVLVAGGAVGVVGAVDGGQPWLAGTVLVAIALRFQGPSEAWRRTGGIALVLALATTVGVTGGPAGPLLGALLVVVAEHARHDPPEWVLAVAVAADAVVVASAVAVAGPAVVAATWVWPLALVPLVGLTAARTLRWRGDEGTDALESATVALDEVLSLAERMPAGFDRWAVAIAVHEEVRAVARDAGASAGDLPQVVLALDGLLFGVGNPIARRPVGYVADLPPAQHRRHWVTVRRSDMPAALARTLEGDRWLLHHLGADETHGVVLVPAELPRPVLGAVGEVLRPAAVALANVHRFERLQALALSAARVRLAHDLHDGVAQALTHLRFELELLGLAQPTIREEVARIRGVAASALVDVRRTVDELRESVPLAERLERHVELLDTFATADVQLDIDAPHRLPRVVADDVFRFAQEGLSNALRHSGATTIQVSLTSDEDGIVLAIIDDGRGLAHETRYGVGLVAMQSRAERLGGRLVHRDRRGGGTVVLLEAPRPPYDHSSPRPLPSEPARQGSPA